MSASIKKSWQDLWQRKGRTLLVVLGLFLGVSGLTCINMTEDTVFSSLTFAIGNQLNQPDIVLAVNTFDPALLSELRATANVREVQEETTLETLWRVTRAPGYTSLKIISYPDLQHIPLTPFELVSGRYPQAGEIVMEYGDRGLQNISLGEKVTIDTAQGLTQLRVVGFARTPGVNPSLSDNAQGYMSETGIERLAAFTTPDHPGNPTRLHLLAFKVNTITRVGATAQALQQLLHAHHITVQLTGFPTASTLPTTQIDGIFTLLRLLVALAITLSALLMFNTVAILVTEQVPIIGTMKALGATRWAIIRGYVLTISIPCVLATLPGVLLGIIGGFLLATQIVNSIPLALGPFTLPPEILPLAIGTGLGVPLLASLLPLWNGTRISVREALSAYGIHAAGTQQRSTPDRKRTRLSWPSQTAWYGLRSLFRKRWRAALMLFTLSLTGISLLVVQTIATSLNNSVSSVYTHLDADIEVDVGDGSFGPLRTQLQDLPNVGRIERYGVGGASTPWGHVALWGFEPSTQLYHYQLTSGHWFQPNDTDVVLLSDNLATKAGLGVGGTLTVSGPNNQLVTWTVIGTVKQAVDSLGQIGAAILPVNTLYRFQGAPASSVATTAQRVLIQTKDRTPAAINQLTDNLGNLALRSLTSNISGDKGGSITNVFLLANEASRYQRNWFPVYGLLYGVALLIGIAGGLGLANELTTVLLERQREIGVLRSMGASTWRIIQVFWVEGLALGGLAWLLSCLVGLPLAYVTEQLFSRLVTPADFSGAAQTLVIVLAALLFVATAASFLPARRAAKRKTASLLRYE